MTTTQTLQKKKPKYPSPLPPHPYTHSYMAIYSVRRFQQIFYISKFLAKMNDQAPLLPLYTRSRANVEPKSSILIGAKVEITPKSFTLGVEAEIQKENFSIYPKY
jgi:hypothetical protein